MEPTLNPLKTELERLEKEKTELESKLKLAEHEVYMVKNIDLKGVEKKISRTREMLGGSVK